MSSLIHGLDQDNFAILSQILIEPLKSKGCKLWLFGSRARGDYKPYSDIDILYEPTTKLNLNEIFEIKSDIEDSHLVYKVDLVSVDELAESYRDQVQREKILL